MTLLLKVAGIAVSTAHLPCIKPTDCHAIHFRAYGIYDNQEEMNEIAFLWDIFMVC